MNSVEEIVIYQRCEMKAVSYGKKWQVWFRTLRQAERGLEFRPFDNELFDRPDAAIAHLKSFLDASSKTPWLFSESGKFLGRSLEK